jgi:hypothetical protein
MVAPCVSTLKQVVFWGGDDGGEGNCGTLVVVLFWSWPWFPPLLFVVCALPVLHFCLENVEALLLESSHSCNRNAVIASRFFLIRLGIWAQIS